ncbi:hypothetical protein F8M41_026211 [Gigaspora margarita]|uniref:Uncharacterized protein n=1 Tax=Gigaspora margarita TaxID=4874 RepID=A0A8H4A973_GIGMA|nr:hypothetical protein F8M41_026211 [Gigaspora margarita]
MGKENFRKLYKRIKSELGDINCKISHFSDKFDESKSYAGMIVYAIDGKFTWKNTGGKASGHEGKSFYIIIQCTNHWPSEAYRDGGGLVHHYLVKNTLGYDYNQDIVCCGGFSYHKNRLKFNSSWLNGKDQKGCRSNGLRHLSDPEQILIEYSFEQYKKYGKDHIFKIPRYIEKQITNRERCIIC